MDVIWQQNSDCLQIIPHSEKKGLILGTTLKLNGKYKEYELQTLAEKIINTLRIWNNKIFIYDQN